MKKLFILIGLCIIILSSFVSANLIDNTLVHYSCDSDFNDDISGKNLTITNGYGINNFTLKLGNGSCHSPTNTARALVSDIGTEFSGTNEFTVSMWIRLDGDLAGEYFNGFGSTLGNSYVIRRNGVDDTTTIRGIGGETSGGTMSLNKFHHVILRRNSTNLAWFMNGSFFISSNSVGSLSSSTQYSFSRWDTNNGFAGYIDEVVLWNRSLSNLEITELYNNGDGLAYPFTISPVSNINMDFYNSSTKSTSFLENDLFQSKLNWTNLNNKVFTELNGTCNISNSLNEFLIYNSTTLLWESSFYSSNVSGIKSFTGVCKHFNNASLNNTINKNIIITNIKPQIQIESVNANGLITNLSQFSTWEYTYGNWTWNISIIDDDLKEVNYSFIASNGTILHFETRNSTNYTKEIITNNSVFRDFAFLDITLNIRAIDFENDTNEINFIFNVSDNNSPTCFNTEDVNIINNTFFNPNIICYDDSLFQMNITCSDGYSFLDTGLDVPSYTLNDLHLITQDTTCTLLVSDGHTKKLIKPMTIGLETSKTKRSFKSEKGKMLTIESATTLNSIETPYKTDRHQIKVKHTKPTLTDSFTITSEEKIYIPSSAQYMGWITTSEYWVDFESDVVRYAEVLRIDDNTVVINLEYFTPQTDIIYNSIGILNTNTYIQNINSYIEGELPLSRTETREFTSLEQGLFYSFLTLFWLIVMICGIVLKGEHGKPIGILLLLQTFVGVVVGLAWFTKFNYVVGMGIIFTSVAVLIGSFHNSK